MEFNAFTNRYAKMGAIYCFMKRCYNLPKNSIDKLSWIYLY